MIGLTREKQKKSEKIAELRLMVAHMQLSGLGQKGILKSFEQEVIGLCLIHSKKISTSVLMTEQGS